MEPSESNARAVRILAYNQLPINEQSVLEMKLADRQVQRAFDSLKPAVVREMIRDGINPLQMQMSELNEQASQIRSRIGGADDLTKYSEYLWKLEHTNSISEAERDAYVGIYRLIHQVETGDGAAIGALVAQGADITMKNLLSAMRSGKKQMDYRVDDAFSGVEGTITNSISAQIEGAYQLECFYQVQKMAKEPEQFGELLQGEDWKEQTPEQLLGRLEEQALNEAYRKQVDERNQQYYATQLAEYEQALMAEDRVWQMLTDYQIPSTVSHVQALQQMLADPNSAIRKLMEIDPKDAQEEDLMEELAKIKEDILEKMGQDLKTPRELAEAQNTLASVAEHCGQTVMYAKGMTTLDLKQLQTMTKQLSLGKPMAGEEHYAIPILTSDGAGMVHVKIVRGKETKGTVGITMESDTLGKVAAKLQAKEKGIDGFVAAESRGAMDRLQAGSEQLQRLLQDFAAENGLGGDVHVPFVQGEHLGLSEFAPMRDRSEDADTKETYQVQTKVLYGIAEKMVTFLRDILEN